MHWSSLPENVGARYRWDAPLMRWAYEWAAANRVGHRFDSSTDDGIYPGW